MKYTAADILVESLIEWDVNTGARADLVGEE